MLQKIVVFLLAEIGDTDGPHFARLGGFLEGFVHFQGVVVGLVDQQQVDIIGLQGFQGALYIGFCLLVAVAGLEQLGGDKNFPPGQTAFPHGAAHDLLVFIHPGGVQQAIAQFQGSENGFLPLLPPHIPGAEAHHGQLYAVVQCQIFHISSCISLEFHQLRHKALMKDHRISRCLLVRQTSNLFPAFQERLQKISNSLFLKERLVCHKKHIINFPAMTANIFAGLQANLKRRRNPPFTVRIFHSSESLSPGFFQDLFILADQHQRMGEAFFLEFF